ncbi:hypothetical protein BN874_300002 [Candidatus Contendobacter odensis Run_B_J11]|uniref:Uncharacterized protein n=1 Tax=Candidatus Contendobacter odensis Run_B_J11 TaxID=1400861 RepID=A0A7U7GCK1_9GAMM|nr:hypothetical protein BN874_300002 [Candidatus Contendobacter odensis Run_B_J11]
MIFKDFSHPKRFKQKIVSFKQIQKIVKNVF